MWDDNKLVIVGKSKFAVLLLFSSFAAGRFFAAAAGLLRGGMPDASILAPATI